MAEIETPPASPPPRQGSGEEATAGSLVATAGGICTGVCSCIFGVFFTMFLFFPFGIGGGMGLLGVLLLVVGLYLMYWSCQYAQRHSKVV
jgi:protein-S-isoprenylcysteine O-methyltransferase Ste14